MLGLSVESPNQGSILAVLFDTQIKLTTPFLEPPGFHANIYNANWFLGFSVSSRTAILEGRDSLSFDFVLILASTVTILIHKTLNGFENKQIRLHKVIQM